MIKVNLLDSVTDRSRSVAAVEARVVNLRTRSTMLMGSVLAVTLLAMGAEYMSSNSAHSAMTAELERQEQTAKQLQAINKEQAELDQKVKATQVRIDAIKKLRSVRQGPVAILSAINERLPAISNFALEKIEQKEGNITIEGHSPNEAAVTEFGRSLEFSSNLFTNFSIEIKRKSADDPPAEELRGVDGVIDTDAPKPEVVTFTIKCKYNQPASASQQGTTDGAGRPATHVAQK
jgi:Tfp pilus assembly protein PilN